MNAKKTAEAEEHLRLAAKALKTGLLKWNPDYDTAGDEYSRAATAFKVSIDILRLSSFEMICFIGSLIW